jgi:hypothetical protein
LLRPDFYRMHTKLLKNSQSFAAVLACPHWVVGGPSGY